MVDQSQNLKWINDKDYTCNVRMWLYYDKSSKQYVFSVQPLTSRKLDGQNGSIAIEEYDPMKGMRAIVLKVERKSSINWMRAQALAKETYLPKMLEQIEASGNLVNIKKEVAKIDDMAANNY